MCMTDEDLAALEEEALRELAIAEAMNKSAEEKLRRLREKKEHQGQCGGTVREFRPRPSGD